MAERGSGRLRHLHRPLDPRAALACDPHERSIDAGIQLAAQAVVS